MEQFNIIYLLKYVINHKLLTISLNKLNIFNCVEWKKITKKSFPNILEPPNILTKLNHTYLLSFKCIISTRIFFRKKHSSTSALIPNSIVNVVILLLKKKLKIFTCKINDCNSKQNNWFYRVKFGECFVSLMLVYGFFVSLLHWNEGITSTIFNWMDGIVQWQRIWSG